MSTGDVAVVAETDDAGDLGEGEACCLGGLNEVQPGECGCVVGHAFIENLRRGHYELAVDSDALLRLTTAFDELRPAI